MYLYYSIFYLSYKRFHENMSDLSLVSQYSSAMQKIDPDHIIALVTEVIPTHSCLVFCPTKKNCENVAGMICKYLKE